MSVPAENLIYIYSSTKNYIYLFLHKIFCIFLFVLKIISSQLQNISHLHVPLQIILDIYSSCTNYSILDKFLFSANMIYICSWEYFIYIPVPKILYTSIPTEYDIFSCTKYIKYLFHYRIWYFCCLIRYCICLFVCVRKKIRHFCSYTKYQHFLEPWMSVKDIGKVSWCTKSINIFSCTFFVLDLATEKYESGQTICREFRNPIYRHATRMRWLRGSLGKSYR